MEQNENLYPDTFRATDPPAPLAITADLRKLEGVQQVFDTVKAKFGRCDILVNSAGATKAGNFVDLPDEAWMDGYALKLFGCVRMCRAFWPMLKSANGFVVNIGGGAARSPGARANFGAVCGGRSSVCSCTSERPILRNLSSSHWAFSASASVPVIRPQN